MRSKGWGPKLPHLSCYLSRSHIFSEKGSQIFSEVVIIA